MTKAKRTYGIVLAIVVALVLIAGIFIPLGTYTPTKGVCPSGEPPVVRLHMILGDSIQEVRESDNELGPTMGCAQQVKYVLYFF